MVSENKGNPFVDLFFFVLQGGHFCLSNVVVNLSNKPLNSAKSSLLSKGFNFCPNPPKLMFVYSMKTWINLYDDLELKNIFIQRKKPVKTYQETNRT
jgi:hypothetical protein